MAPPKTTYQFHHKHEASSKHSPYLASNPTERMKRDHVMPSIWVKANDYQCIYLQDVIGDQWNNSERLLGLEMRTKNVSATAKLKCIGEKKPEKITRIWLQEKAGFSNFKVNADREIAMYKEKGLQSYFISKTSRSDVWIGLESGFPLGEMEILSNESLDHTVGECQRAAVNRLRFYRNYDTEVTQVKGFVLPAPKLSIGDHHTKDQVKGLEHSNDKRKCPILMITMSWTENEFEFSSELTAVPQQCFEKQLIESITVSSELAERVSKLQLQFSNFFAPVGTTGFMKVFGSGAIQLPSGKSIVVAYKDFVYKLAFSSQNLTNTLRTVSKLLELDNAIQSFLLLPTFEGLFPLFKGLFFKFRRLIYPLFKDEARASLYDFLLKAAYAISQLHACEYGHFDIRLENICFDLDSDEKDVHAVLIDLDSVACVDDTTHTYQQDWKHFGIMAAFILEETQVTNDNYHDPNFQFQVYSGPDKLFFNELCKNGEPSLLCMLCVQ